MEPKHTVKIVNASMDLSYQRMLKENVDAFFRAGERQQSENSIKFDFVFDNSESSLENQIRSNRFSPVVFFGINLLKSIQTTKNSAEEENASPVSKQSFNFSMPLANVLHSIQAEGLMNGKVVVPVCNATVFFKELFNNNVPVAVKDKRNNEFNEISDFRHLLESAGENFYENIPEFKVGKVLIKGLVHFESDKSLLNQASLKNVFRQILAQAESFSETEFKINLKETETYVSRHKIMLVLPKVLSQPLEQQLKIQGNPNVHCYESVEEVKETASAEAVKTINQQLSGKNWALLNEFPPRFKQMLCCFCSEKYSFGALEDHLKLLPKLKETCTREMFTALYESFSPGIREMMLNGILKDKGKIYQIRINDGIRKRLLLKMHVESESFLQAKNNLLAEKAEDFFNGMQHSIILFHAYYRPEIFEKEWKRFIYGDLPYPFSVQNNPKKMLRFFLETLKFIEKNISPGIIPSLMAFRNSDQLQETLIDFSDKIFEIFYEVQRIPMKTLIWDRVSHETKVSFYDQLTQEERTIICVDNFQEAIQTLHENKEALLRMILGEEQIQAAGALNFFLSESNPVAATQEAIENNYQSTVAQGTEEQRKHFTALLQNQFFGKEIHPMLVKAYRHYLDNYQGVVCLKKDQVPLKKIPQLEKGLFFVLDKEINAEILEAILKKHVSLSDLGAILHLLEKYLGEEYEKLKNDHRITECEKYVSQRIQSLLKISILVMRQQHIDEKALSHFDKMVEDSDILEKAKNDCQKLKAAIFSIEKKRQAVQQRILACEAKFENTQKHYRKVEGDLNGFKKKNAAFLRLLGEIQTRKVRFAKEKKSIYVNTVKLLSEALLKNLETIKHLPASKKADKQAIMAPKYYFKFRKEFLGLFAKQDIFLASEQTIFLRLVSTMLSKDSLKGKFLIPVLPQNLPSNPNFVIADQAAPQNFFSGIPKNKLVQIDIGELNQKIRDNEQEKEALKKLIGQNEKEKNEMDRRISVFISEMGGIKKQQSQVRQILGMEMSKKGALDKKIMKGQFIFSKSAHEYKTLVSSKVVIDKKVTHFKKRMETIIGQSQQDADSTAFQKALSEFLGDFSNEVIDMKHLSESLLRLNSFIDFASVLSAKIRKTFIHEIAFQRILSLSALESGKFETRLISDGNPKLAFLTEQIQEVVLKSPKVSGEQFEKMDWNQLRGENTPKAGFTKKPTVYLFVVDDSGDNLRNIYHLTLSLKGYNEDNCVVVFSPYKPVYEVFESRDRKSELLDITFQLSQIAKLHNVTPKFRQTQKFIEQVLN